MYSFFFTFCSVSGHHAPLNLLWSGEKGEEGKTQGAEGDIDLKYAYSSTYANFGSWKKLCYVNCDCTNVSTNAEFPH